ncbi:MAG: ABC transporter substrate-binding protein [Hyphomicrobiaceae bacterium]
MRTRLAVAVWAMLATCAAMAAPVAAAPQRIVSINACTDQLLLALADRAQIQALTHHVDDPSMSYFSDRAEGVLRIRGQAEEVLKLEPDLVVAGRFTRRETRQRLAYLGLRVELFSTPATLAETRATILNAADIFGQPERGRAAVEALDRQIARVRPIAAGVRVLQLQRRGFVSGAGTLIDDLLRSVGARNAGAEVAFGGRVVRTDLETILKLAPDAILLFSSDPEATRLPGFGPILDQGQALLAHPALAGVVPRDRWIAIPSNTVTCGGPQVAAALGLVAQRLAEIAGTASRR